VDDIPLLLAHSDQMGVPQLLDDSFKPHGNWEGLSLGWTTAVWVAHILSEGDHRMNQVQSWAAHRMNTLSICTGQKVSERGFSDDRLTLVLDTLSDEQKWQHFETQQDYYLCPLSSKQMPDEVLEAYLQPVWAGEQPVTTVSREQEGGQQEQIAEGYERRVTLSSEVGGRTISWTERHLIVRSHKLAQAATQALHARVVKAHADLERLTEHKQGKKRYTDGATLQQAAQAIIRLVCG
jgi:transposase